MKLTKNYSKDGNFVNVIIECENPGEMSAIHQAVEEAYHSFKDKDIKARYGKMLATFQNREA